MDVFMLAQAGESSLAEFTDLVLAPTHTWVEGVATAFLRFNQLSKQPKMLDRHQELDYQLAMLSKAAEAQMQAMVLKDEGKVDRPEYVKHPEYVGTYASPCSFAFIMASVVKECAEFFEVEDPVIAYDTAFLLAFLPAMAGLNSEQACMDAMDIVFK